MIYFKITARFRSIEDSESHSCPIYQLPGTALENNSEGRKWHSILADWYQSVLQSTTDIAGAAMFASKFMAQHEVVGLSSQPHTS